MRQKMKHEMDRLHVGFRVAAKDLSLGIWVKDFGYRV